jgi:hypothetical protein
MSSAIRSKVALLFFALPFVVGLPGVASSVSMCDPGPDFDGDCVSDAREQHLIDRFAPLLRFDHEEQYKNSSVPWYLPRVGMQLVCPNAVVTLAQPGAIQGPSALFRTVICDGVEYYSGATIDGNGGLVKTPFELFHDRDDEPFRLDTRKGDLATAEIYAHVRPSPWPHLTAYDITYWFFYPWNGDVNQTLNIGHHQGDWEHVTVRAEEDGSGGWRMHSMFFATHEGGYWTWPGQVETIPGTQQPVVYVAHRTHASYAESGFHPLVYEDIVFYDYDDNDPAPCIVPADDGLGCWNTRDEVVNIGERGRLTPEAWFLAYSGQWGPNDGSQSSSPRGPVGKDTFVAERLEDDPGCWDDSSSACHAAHPWIWISAERGQLPVVLGEVDQRYDGYNEPIGEFTAERLNDLVALRCGPIGRCDIFFEANEAVQDYIAPGLYGVDGVRITLRAARKPSTLPATPPPPFPVRIK